ncbi:MAG: Hsp20/alpha crystallin family protein [Anaerolineae bacterium]|nr:Hsp20/alpha crystallin family protein [Anaerolineae bacterium]
MATLVRWNPARDLAAMHRAMDRMFEAPVAQPRWRVAANHSFGNVAVNLYETDDSVVVEATLPGYTADQVDLSVEDGILTLKGEVNHDSEGSNAEDNANGNSPKYYVRERFHGSFERRFRLPSEVDADTAEANFENGLLTITLPKAEAAKRRQIPVKAS